MSHPETLGQLLYRLPADWLIGWGSQSCCTYLCYRRCCSCSGHVFLSGWWCRRRSASFHTHYKWLSPRAESYVTEVCLWWQRLMYRPIMDMQDYIIYSTNSISFLLIIQIDVSYVKSSILTLYGVRTFSCQQLNMQKVVRLNWINRVNGFLFLP